MDEKSLSHTKWNCKYHIVLVPKYRRKVIYKRLRKDIGKILRRLCEYKHVEIVEAHAMPDHIHMLVSIPPKLAVADFVGYLKGKSIPYVQYIGIAGVQNPVLVFVLCILAGIALFALGDGCWKLLVGYVKSVSRVNRTLDA